MAAIVEPIRFWGGLVVAVIGAALGILSQFVIAWIIVLVGLAFLVDGLTAVRCPNGHLIGLRTRFGLAPPFYCPTCGVLVDRKGSDDG